MKCGAIHTLALLFHRSSSKRKRCIAPINRVSAEAGRETRQRSDARRIFHSAAGCYQDTTQTDRTKDSKTIGFGVFLGTFCTSKKYLALGAKPLNRLRKEQFSLALERAKKDQTIYEKHRPETNV